MSTSVKSPTANIKPNRLPAPTLFVGPPSRNASQLSVSRQVPDKATREHTTTRQKPATGRPPTGPEETNEKDGPTSILPTFRKPSERTLDAKWREMQSTLNEVELTAQSSTHVFGASHAAALDELRNAQVELARAWGRGNDQQAGSSPQSTTGQQAQRESDIGRFQAADDLAGDRVQTAGGRGRKRGDTETSASTTLSGESVVSEEGMTGRSGSSLLEDETAQDIRLASERRAANEAYFKTVEAGVRDVVAKLEVVAEAMRSVEGESRSLWSGSERSSDEATGKLAGRAEEA